MRLLARLGAPVRIPAWQLISAQTQFPITPNAAFAMYKERDADDHHDDDKGDDDHHDGEKG